MNKNYEAIHKYDFLTKELLIAEYVQNGLTDREIAEKYNMPSKTVVWRKRKKFGIENKQPGKSNKNASKNRKFQISLQEAQSLLSDGKKFEEIAEHMGCSIVVAKRRFKELGLSRECKQVQNFSFYNEILFNEQKQLLMGGALGDGYLTKHNAFFCRHSVKQSDYIFHKMSVLSSLHLGAHHYVDGVDPQGNPTKGICFTTGCHKFITKMRPIFYPNNGSKVFPYDFLVGRMDEIGVAYWFMDDGTTNYTKFQQGKRSRPVHKFCTDSFSREDCEKACEFFDVRFGIKAGVASTGTQTRKDGGRMYNVFIYAKSDDEFISLIRPYVIPMFEYKVDYDAYKIWREKNAILFRRA